MKQLFIAVKTVHYDEYFLVEVEVGAGDDQDVVEKELTEALQRDELGPYYTHPRADDESVTLTEIADEGGITVMVDLALQAGAREYWRLPPAQSAGHG